MGIWRGGGKSLDGIRDRLEDGSADLTGEDVEYLLETVDRNFATLEGSDAATLLAEVADQRPGLVARQTGALTAVIAGNKTTRAGALIWQHLLDALGTALDRSSPRSVDRYELVAELAGLLDHSSGVRERSVALVVDLLSGVTSGTREYQRLNDWLTADLDVDLQHLSTSVLDTVEEIVASDASVRSLREGAPDYEELETVRAVCLLFRLAPARFENDADVVELIDLLGHDDERIRRSAVSVHGAIADSDVFYPLTAESFRAVASAAERGDPEVQRAVAAITAEFAERASATRATGDLLAELAAAADHDSEAVREAVATVVAGWDDADLDPERLDEGSVAHLFGLLRTPDPSASATVAATLEAVLRADAERVARSVEADPSTAPQAADFLVTRLGSREYRAPATRALARVAETAPEALAGNAPAVATAVTRGTDDVATQACEILARMATEEAVEQLRRAANETNDLERKSTIETAVETARERRSPVDDRSAETQSGPDTEGRSGGTATSVSTGSKANARAGSGTGTDSGTRADHGARTDAGARTDTGTGPDAPPDAPPSSPDVDVDYETLTDEEPLGAGGNADVRRATLPAGDGRVSLAIKEPRVSGTLHTEAVESLLEEAETWSKLDDHDHVVGVVDYGAQPFPWIAMEYMDAGHLGERAGDLPPDQALWTAVAVTNAVWHAHRRGVAHLDLKPENVLFRETGDGWNVPKVADWGLSKQLLDHSKSVEGFSPHYAAPEQFDDSYGPTDDITDVYQLGAVFYELFTGRAPFEGSAAQVMRKVLAEDPEPPTAVDPDVPDALDDVLLTALAKEREDRYEDVLYLRDALRDLFAEY